MSYANITLKTDLRYLPRKVQKIAHDPRVLKELGDTWRSKFENFIPVGATGNLVDRAYATSDGYIIYNTPYAHYIWQGEEYVYDMEYDETTGELKKRYFAPKGVGKIPSGDMLKDVGYMPPNYEPHWNRVAYNVYKGEVAEHMTEFIKRL